MNYIVKVVIFIIPILLFIPYSAFAQEDNYEIIGKTLTHDPTICTLEPETDIPDFGLPHKWQIQNTQKM